MVDEAKYVVGKVGWGNENSACPILLLDKKERDKLGLAVGDIVNVKHNSNITSAVINLQFREFIGSKKAVLSSNLSTKLDCIEGDKVQIVGKASESEANALKQLIEQKTRQMMGQLSQMPRMFGNPSPIRVVRIERGF